MDFEFPVIPSLVHITTARIAIELWTHSDVRNQMTRYESFRTSWKMNQCEWIESSLMKKVEQLQIPKSLEMRIKAVIRPVGNEMLSYCFCDYDYFLMGEAQNCWQAGPNCWIDYLRWTPFGTVDRKKTASIFIEKEMFSVHWRYELACESVCENSIPRLWNELSECGKECVLKGQFVYTNYWDKYSLIHFWTSGLLEAARKENPGENLFLHFVKYAIGKKNPAAFAYFWDKLSSEERDNNVMELAKLVLIDRNDSVLRSIILMFLLSQLSNSQEILELPILEIFYCFLNCWFAHDYFLPTIKRVWSFISHENCIALLDMIVRAMDYDKCNTRKYENWFRQLWLKTSKHFKKHFLEHGHDVCHELILHGKFECMKLILDDCCTNSERKRILCSATREFTSCGTSFRFIHDWHWDTVGKLVTISLGSNEDFPDFVRLLIQNYFRCGDLISDDKWLLFDRLVNFIDASHEEEEEERIIEMKQQLMYEDGRRICWYLLDYANDLPLIDEFLVWGLSTTERIRKFKKVLLIDDSNGNHVSVFCGKLLENGQLEYADEFVRNCFPNEVEVREFKKRLIYSPEVIGLFISLMNDIETDQTNDLPVDEKWSFTSNIFKWFHLEKLEEVGRFKEKFLGRAKRWKQHCDYLSRLFDRIIVTK